MKRCRNCARELPVKEFPLARPRKDGTRWPFDYCETCLTEQAVYRQPLRDGGVEAHRRANRLQMRRVRVGNP